MKATRRIYIALTICTIAVELCAQSSSTALPNAPEAHAFLLASAQSAPSLSSPLPTPTEGTPTLLTRQQA